MNQALQAELVRKVFAHLDAGTTDLADAVWRQPVESYASAQRIARESEVLFRRYPLLMGLSCQLREPGDYLTDDFSGIPILVVRGKDGKLRALQNVCRHRGSRAAEGCGKGAKTFVCPYHGWTYDLEGNLRGIPDERSFPGVERAQHGLQPLPLSERHGMVWVQPTPANGAAAPDNLGATLAAEFASYGLEQFHHYQSRVIRRSMNWKLAIDTFLEPYHLGVLHRNTVASIFLPNLCLFEAFGPNLRQVLPRRSVESLRGRPESEWNIVAHSAIVYVLFPNTVFVMQADHVEIWRVFPFAGRADECVMQLEFYVPQAVETDSARRHWQRNLDLTIRTVCDEDFPTSEGMQRGFQAGAQTHVIYGRNEPALAHFEQAISSAIE